MFYSECFPSLFYQLMAVILIYLWDAYQDCSQADGSVVSFVRGV